MQRTLHRPSGVLCQLALGIQRGGGVCTQLARMVAFINPSSIRNLSSTHVSQQFMMEGPRESTSTPGQAPSNWQGVKRFYTEVGVERAEDGTGWSIIVQGRALRTSNLKDLVVPTKALALAVAAEFGMQGSRIIPSTTPLYNLCCSAIDGYAVDDERKGTDTDREDVQHRANQYLMEQASGRLRLALAGSVQNGSESRGADQGKGKGKEKSTGDRSISVRRATDAAIDAPDGDLSDEEAASLGDSWPLGAACRRVAHRGWDAEDGAVSAVIGDIVGLREPGAESGMQTAAMAGTDRLRNQLKEYLETDTACYRVRALSAADAILRRKQDRHYQPLLEWFREAYGLQLSIAEGFSMTEHPVEALEICEDFVDRADPFLRAALALLLGSTKSTLTSMALLHRQITAAQAFECARVEEEFQIEENGFVEDGHDTARAETKLKAASASTLLWLLPQSAPGVGVAAVAAVVGPREGAAEATTPDAQGLVGVDAEPRRRRRRRRQEPVDGGSGSESGNTSASPSSETGEDNSDRDGAEAQTGGDADDGLDATPRVVHWHPELRAAIARTRRRRCLELSKELLEQERSEELRKRWDIDDESKRFADMTPEEAQVAALREMYKKHTAGTALATEQLEAKTTTGAADIEEGGPQAVAASIPASSSSEALGADLARTKEEGQRRGAELDRLLSQVPGIMGGNVGTPPGDSSGGTKS